MTDTDSLQVIADVLRDHHDMYGLADRIERLDAEMRKDLESGFMDGAYARLKSLQERERECDDLRARLAACENLRAFAREALEDFWEGDGTMQDLGEKHHLLIPTVVNEPCGEGCSCAEYDADFPAECYRFAPVLAAQSSAKVVG